MPFLTYISDEHLFGCVDHLLLKANEAKENARKKFNKNVIDPFSPIFEIAGFDVDHTNWVESELTRQSQKSVSNNIGLFHQNILGGVEEWVDLGVGSQVDLVNESRKIIAEVKNKYNTVKQSDLHNVYAELDELVSRKSSNYKDYQAYLVTIIPKSPVRFNKLFTPSNKEKGKPCAANDAIRAIDGTSFYEIVTGEKDALSNLFHSLPAVIALRAEALSLPFKKFSQSDIKDIEEYFRLAYCV